MLDTGALLRVEALSKYRQSCTLVTTAEAAQEVRDAMARQRLAEQFLDIHTVQPTAADLRWAETFAEMTGDLPFLSGTDLGLIALTYMLQRATGQTERLRLRPPAYEYFCEAEFQNALESSGNSKSVWTLQRGNPAGTSDSTTPPAAKESAEPKGGEDDDAVKRATESVADPVDREDDMEEEEGWVTEELLRNHLGLASSPCPGAPEHEGNIPETIAALAVCLKLLRA